MEQLTPPPALLPVMNKFENAHRRICYCVVQVNGPLCVFHLSSLSFVLISITFCKYSDKWASLFKFLSSLSTL